MLKENKKYIFSQPLIMAVVRFQYDISIIVYPILDHVKFKLLTFYYHHFQIKEFYL